LHFINPLSAQHEIGTCYDMTARCKILRESPTQVPIYSGHKYFHASPPLSDVDAGKTLFLACANSAQPVGFALHRLFLNRFTLRVSNKSAIVSQMVNAFFNSAPTLQQSVYVELGDIEEIVNTPSTGSGPSQLQRRKGARRALPYCSATLSSSRRGAMATDVPFADNRGPSSQNRCLGVTTDHPFSAGCNEQ